MNNAKSDNLDDAKQAEHESGKANEASSKDESECVIEEVNDTVAQEDDGSNIPDVNEAEVLRAEIEKLKDEFLRARAEADNVRKRAQGEITNARRFALEAFATELLNVRDSLDIARSIDLKTEESVLERVAEGLELTLRQFDSVFDKFSIFKISPEIGDKLDPESHQAMSLIESDDVAPNHICQVIQHGYRLNDRLLRPARVIVSKDLSAE